MRVLREMTRLWFLGLLTLLTPAKTLAADWPVCSAAEIRSVMQMAQPGDTLVMCNGVWTNQPIVFEGDGEEGKPITLRAETPGQVILTGSSSLKMGGTYLIVDGLYFTGGALTQFGANAVVEFRSRASRHCHYCRLTNTVIEDYNPVEDPSRPRDEFRYRWVSLYGTHNWVDHSGFTGKTNAGSLLVVVRRTVDNQLTDEPQHHKIERNYFKDRPFLGRDAEGNLINGGDIITIGESGNSLSDSLTTVESNVFERCDGEVELISSKSGGNKFLYNTFIDSQGTLTLRHGNGALVAGNFFFGNDQPDTGGVRVIGEDHVVINNYFSGIAGSADTFRSAVNLFNGVPNSPLNGHFQVKNAVIAFNTFVDNQRNIIIGGGKNNQRTLPPLDSKIANNIVVRVTGPDTPCLINVVDEPINMTYEGNIMYGACLGVPPVSGIDMIDPNLALSDDGLYRPATGSWAIDRAVGDYPVVTTDMDGQPRDDGFKDVGADELSTASITRRPLTPEDVGAPWFRQP